VQNDDRAYRADRLLPDATLPFASFGAGLTLRTPTRVFEDRGGRMASLSVGLMVEGGYALRAPLELNLDGPGPGDGDIALSEGSLGELSRSGPYVRTSIVLRY
jgi:hypothetical protein